MQFQPKSMRIESYFVLSHLIDALQADMKSSGVCILCKCICVRVCDKRGLQHSHSTHPESDNGMQWAR